MPSILKWIIGIFIFLIFGFYYVHKVKAPELRPIVQKKIQDNLAKENLSHLQVNVDEGLNVALSGVAGSEEEQARAEEACMVCGNGEVDTSGMTAGSIDKYNIFAERYVDPNQRILLKGVVPNQAVKDAILSKVESIYGAGNFIDQLVVENFSGEGVSLFQNLAVNAIPYLSNFDGISSLKMNSKESIYNGSYSETGLSGLVKSKLKGLGGASYAITFPSKTIVVSTTVTTLPKFNCQKEINSLLAGEKILFNTSDYNVSSSSYPLLQSLANTLSKCPKWGVRIEGHTDTRGAASFNQTLSENRAGAVKSKLIEFGTSSSRVESIGYGETKPLTSEANASELAKNRRIEIKLQGE